MNTNKTLAEMTNEVLNSRLSANKKAAALVKIGVTPYEAMVLAHASMPRKEAFTYSFGVEIECINCRFDAFRSAATANGLRVYDRMFYNHNDMPIYKLTTDGSLQGDAAAECVTPPLSSKGGFSSLKACCKSLAEIGATTNRSCGLHVHIGAAALTDEEYCNVFVNYMRLETAIESFLAPSRRGMNARWCASLRSHEARVLSATTKYEMLNALDGDRYHRVNPVAYNAHQTIEFRQHQGTTNYAKISHWVKFLGKLVEFSKDSRLSANIDRIEDIPFLSAAEKNYFCSRRAALA